MPMNTMQERFLFLSGMERGMSIVVGRSQNITLRHKMTTSLSLTEFTVAFS